MTTQVGTLADLLTWRDSFANKMVGIPQAYDRWWLEFLNRRTLHFTYSLTDLLLLFKWSECKMNWRKANMLPFFNEKTCFALRPPGVQPTRHQRTKTGYPSLNDSQAQNCSTCFLVLKQLAEFHLPDSWMWVLGIDFDAKQDAIHLASIKRNQIVFILFRTRSVIQNLWWIFSVTLRVIKFILFLTIYCVEVIDCISIHGSLERRIPFCTQWVLR